MITCFIIVSLFLHYVTLHCTGTSRLPEPFMQVLHRKGLWTAQPPLQSIFSMDQRADSANHSPSSAFCMFWDTGMTQGHCPTHEENRAMRNSFKLATFLFLYKQKNMNKIFWVSAALQRKGLNKAQNWKKKCPKHTKKYPFCWVLVFYRKLYGPCESGW